MHEGIQKISRRPYEAIFNFGCGDGLYSLGFARIFSHLPVYAFDTRKVALDITRENAVLNHLSANISARSFDSAHALELLSLYCQFLITIDLRGCDGAFFFEPNVISRLMYADFVVKATNSNPLITSTLWRIFGATHKIEVMHPQGRNPNSIPCLAGLSEIQQFEAVHENRESMTHWLIATPYQSGGDPAPACDRILTIHGTYLYVDDQLGIVKHGFPPEAKPNAFLRSYDDFCQLVYKRGCFSNALGLRDDLLLCPNAERKLVLKKEPLEDGLIAIRGGDSYLCAESNGFITLSRATCSEWERFNLIHY